MGAPRASAEGNNFRQKGLEVFHLFFNVENRLACEFGRRVLREPRLVGRVKGHNMNETSFPGSPALWAGSFTIRFATLEKEE